MTPYLVAKSSDLEVESGDGAVPGKFISAFEQLDRFETDNNDVEAKNGTSTGIAITEAH